MDEKKYQGWAVVTGASSGIGFELAKQFVQHGFDVLITAEDADIQKAAQDLQAFGTRVEALQTDLRYDSGVEILHNKIKSLGPLEAIAINAGVGVGGASFDKTDLVKELDMLRLNVLSTVHLAKLVLPGMLAAGRGRILFTSSVAAFLPGPYESVYAASKAFVQSFAEGLHAEVADKGVVITALQPGPTETNFFHRAGMDDTKIGPAKKDDAALVAQQGFEALMRGDHAVLAGSTSNKIQGNIAKVIPQQAAAKMHARMTKPNSPSDR